jgi:hypothetical protein
MKALLWCSLLTACALQAQADVFKCVEDGKVSFTQDSGPRCRLVNLGVVNPSEDELARSKVEEQTQAGEDARIAEQAKKDQALRAREIQILANEQQASDARYQTRVREAQARAQAERVKAVGGNVYAPPPADLEE